MVQEVTTKSWGSRIASSIAGIFIGFIMIIGACVLIFWNEAHSLHNFKVYKHVKKIVISVPASPVDPKNNNQVVHVSGLTKTDDILRDPLFDIAKNTIKLQRQVEMYQWEEKVEVTHEKQAGGSEKEIKNYTYQPVWSQDLINSNKFKDLIGHQNPEVMPLRSASLEAKHVQIGNFKLAPILIHQIQGTSLVDLSKIYVTALQTKLNKSITPDAQGNLYVGVNPQKPEIGDMKISLVEVAPQIVSVIAQQRGDSLQAYLPAGGPSIALLGMGEQSAGELLATAQNENKMQTWILRAVSLILMIIGIALIFKPLAVVADVLPFLGNIVGMGTGIVAFVTGLILWIVMTVFAWIIFRPLLALGFLILLGLFIYAVYKHKKRS